MATFGVRSGSLDRFAAGRVPLNHAAWANQSEQARTVAPTRQAGGHWFEPSTAHSDTSGSREPLSYAGQECRAGQEIA
jgi:hypothetical protein